jgi:glutamyl-tRNA synthetase
MSVRVRFAPSPTGALHIGGIRTALYNFLFAKKHGGTFILRIEDTDQGRYVPGAEEYIMQSLEWCGIIPDESPLKKGPHAPYRQSQRKEIYQEYAKKLVESGHGYYAFDTPDELEKMRTVHISSDGQAIPYNHFTRMYMRNSLTLNKEEVGNLLSKKVAFVIRLKVDPGKNILIHDLVRETVSFHSDELDDKVMLKSDGMPTYHLANVVDDRLMEISHVIRGEEWLPSTAHHVLLYEAFGWTETMPKFAHLPLILKPTGQGKLSKRDGQKLGIPVFPIGWEGESKEDSFGGFREAGFLPEAMLNFLAFMGWNPGTEQEIFSVEELVEVFSLEKIVKSGARFDFEKAKWFNHQYIQKTKTEDLTSPLVPIFIEAGVAKDVRWLERFVSLMKDRCYTLRDFIEKGDFLLNPISTFDEVQIKKRWKENSVELLNGVCEFVEEIKLFDVEHINESLHDFMDKNAIKPGDLMPLMRLSLAGTMQGPGVPEMISLLGKEESLFRMKNALEKFPKILES